MPPSKHIRIDDDSASISSFRTNFTYLSFNLISNSWSFQWVNNSSTYALFHWLNLELKLSNQKQLAGPILDQAIKSIEQLRKKKLN
ncbi:hypothetical protein RhiirA1_487214 [Rhizophagus irregularis]|uniref:Uncharacterized protein n=1 Tax=Rhizophagus irregularis TaxID=588596 RepID=A0A2N0QGI0_9GLOM|nr:hypothetical protein RhiirA1_487214 [Rhizophagus irregularis]